MTAVDLELLARELTAAGVPFNGLTSSDLTVETVMTYDDGDPIAAIIPLPPEADPVLAAHVAPPRVIEYAGQTDVSAIVRTTDDVVLEVFRFPCETKHLYRANLTISGIDANNFVSLVQEGRFVWKRALSNAVISGITVVSQIPTTIPSGWATNCVPDGTDIVFTVKGPAGRTIDWLLVGEVGRYAPEGLTP